MTPSAPSPGAPASIRRFPKGPPAFGGESENGIVEFQAVTRAKVSGTFLPRQENTSTENADAT